MSTDGTEILDVIWGKHDGIGLEDRALGIYTSIERLDFLTLYMYVHIR